MKRFTLYILIVLISLNSYAQHYLGGCVELAMPYMLDQIEITTPKVGIGTGLNMLYQYQRNAFLLNTGVGLAYESTRQGLINENLTADMIDTRGLRFTYLGQLEQRIDHVKMWSLQIPLLMGFEYNYFYLLAGARLSIPINIKTMQTAQLATQGDYLGRYYDIVENMPNHGYHDFERTQTKGSVNFNLDVKGEIELGYTTQIYTSSKPATFRIGLFAEYGILNTLNNSADQPLTALDVSQYMNVTMNNIYSSSAASGNLHTLTFGMRLTYLFPFADSSNSRYRSSYRSSRHSHNHKCRCEGY